MQLLHLIPHPDSPAASISSIDVSASLTPTGGLSLTYVLRAKLSHLHIPEPTTPNRTDNLWRHTCFEVFIKSDDAQAYREFNFSPAGAWQAYAFTNYRNGGLLEPAPAPTLIRRDVAGQMILEGLLSAAALPAGTTLRLALSAIIEAADGTLSYWALRHPPGKPDFHHTDAFALTLQRP